MEEWKNFLDESYTISFYDEIYKNSSLLDLGDESDEESSTRLPGDRAARKRRRKKLLALANAFKEMGSDVSDFLTKGGTVNDDASTSKVSDEEEILYETDDSEDRSWAREESSTSDASFTLKEELEQEFINLRGMDYEKEMMERSEIDQETSSKRANDVIEDAKRIMKLRLKPIKTKSIEGSKRKMRTINETDESNSDNLSFMIDEDNMIYTGDNDDEDLMNAQERQLFIEEMQIQERLEKEKIEYIENDKNIDVEERIRKMHETKREAEEYNAINEEEEDEMDEGGLNLIINLLKENKTARHALNALENLEKMRHDRYLKLLLDNLKQPDRVVARFEGNARTILRGMYIKRFNEEEKLAIMHPMWLKEKTNEINRSLNNRNKNKIRTIKGEKAKTAFKAKLYKMAGNAAIRERDEKIKMMDKKIDDLEREKITLGGNFVKPSWWKLTPDSLVEMDGKVKILEVSVSSSKRQTRELKREKYKGMAMDTGTSLLVSVIMPGEMMTDLYGRAMEDYIYDVINSKIDDVKELIDEYGLKDEVNKARRGDRIIRDRDTDIPTGLQLFTQFSNKEPDLEGFMKDIIEKVDKEKVFEKTTEKKIIEGFEDAMDKIEETFDTENVKENSLNFLFSTRGFGKGEKEDKQVERILRAMELCHDENPRGMAMLYKKKLSGEIKEVNVTNGRMVRNWMSMAKVKPFWDKAESILKRKDENKERGGSKPPKSWNPRNPEHVMIANLCGEELEKMDKPMESRKPLYCPENMEGPEGVYKSARFANSILNKTQNTVGLGMCRFAAMMGQKVIHMDAKMKGNFDVWTGGFSSNALIKLPCDQVRGPESDFPFISVSLYKSNSELVKLTRVMHEETINLDGELVKICFSYPQRLHLRQMEQWSNADLEAINFISLNSKANDDFYNDAKLFPIGHAVMLMLNQHLSLTYLCESMKFLGQLSISDYSRVRSFCKDEMGKLIGSPYECYLWLKCLDWSIDCFNRKPRGKKVIFVDADNDTSLKSSLSESKFKTVYSGDNEYSLAEMENQMTSPFMCRKKNQHDRIQGLMKLYMDVTELQLDWEGDKDISVKEMEIGGKFTYDGRFIDHLTDLAENNYYKEKSLEIKLNYEDSGTFDSHGILATNKGSRKMRVKMGGLLETSTNIEESLGRKDKYERVIDVATEMNDEVARFEFAQKEQRGKDRAIGITQFPNRCLLRSAEDLAKSHNKVLPNEAMNKSGDMKIKITQTKINKLVKDRIELIERGNAVLFFISADNTKHSEHDALDKYERSWKRHKHLGKDEIGVVLNALKKMRDRRVHLPERIWRYFQEMSKDPFEKNKEIAEFWGIESNQPFPGGWVQGMFNNISTKLHAEAQLAAVDVVRKIIGRDIEFEGGVHSDDSWGAFLIFLKNGDDVDEVIERVANSYYWCMQSAGFRLNVKKTSLSGSVIEFLSRHFNFGDQVSSNHKVGLAVISDLPCRGPGIDFPSGYGKISAYLREGGEMVRVQLMATLIRTQINRMYSMGKDEINDPLKGVNADISKIPINLGGHLAVPPLVLMMHGPSAHNLMLLFDFENLRPTEKKMLCAAIPSKENDVSMLLNAVGRQVDGGWKGPTNSPDVKRAIRKAKERLGIEDEEAVKKIIKDHPVLRFDKPKQHERLMEFNMALICDGDFARGLTESRGIGTVIRLAKSVRGDVWPTGNEVFDKKKGKKVRERITLRQYFDRAQRKRIETDIVNTLKECYSSSSMRIMLMQEQMVHFEGCAEHERMSHSMKIIRPVPGERNVEANIGSMLMYEYDLDFFREDGRVDDLKPEWNSQMQLLREVKAKVRRLSEKLKGKMNFRELYLERRRLEEEQREADKMEVREYEEEYDGEKIEGIPIEQEMALVYTILNQDKRFKIFLSMPNVNVRSPNDLFNAMYTYKFLPGMICKVKFEPMPIKSYASATFMISHKASLRRALACAINIHKWLISSEEWALIDKVRECKYLVDDRKISIDELIEEGIKSMGVTQPMKDDLMVLKAFLEYGINEEFTNKEIEDRFSKISYNEIEKEYRQKKMHRSKGEGWEGYGRFSVSMKPDLYTALEFEGDLHMDGKQHKRSDVNIAQIVTNHRNEGVVNIMISVMRNYLGKMTEKQFFNAFATDNVRTGLRLIGETFTKVMLDESDEPQRMILWKHDHQQEPLIKNVRVNSYKINSSMNLVGLYPDQNVVGRFKHVTVRRTWSWAQMPTQGSIEWIDSEGVEIERNYGVMKLNLNQLERFKGISNLSSSIQINLSQLAQCVRFESDDKSLLAEILGRFIQNRNEFNSKLKLLKVDKKIIEDKEQVDMSLLDVVDWENLGNAVLKEGAEESTNLMPGDEDVLDYIASELDKVREEETDKGKLQVIRTRGGMSLSYTLELGIRMMMSDAIKTYMKEDILRVWSQIVSICTYIIAKENESEDKDWNMEESDKMEFRRSLEMIGLIMECSTSYSLDDPPTVEEYDENRESNVMLRSVDDFIKNGFVNKVGNFISTDLRNRRDTVSVALMMNLGRIREIYMAMEKHKLGRKINTNLDLLLKRASELKNRKGSSNLKENDSNVEYSDSDEDGKSEEDRRKVKIQAMFEAASEERNKLMEEMDEEYDSEEDFSD